MSFVLTGLVSSYSSPIKNNNPAWKYLGPRNAEVEPRWERALLFYLREKF